MSTLPSNYNHELISGDHHPAESINDKMIAKCTMRTRTDLWDIMRPFPQEALDLFTAQLHGRGDVDRASALGDLKKIPTEIMTMILLAMDVASLIKFSHASSITRALVQQVPEFQLVTKYAGTTAFMGVIATRLSNYYSIADLYTVLTTSQCSCCKGYAEIVHLPTLERFCLACFFHGCKSFPTMLVSIDKPTKGVNPKIPILMSPTVTDEEVLHTFAIFPTSLTSQMTDGGLVSSRADLTSTKPWTLCNILLMERAYIPESSRWFGLPPRRGPRYPGLLASMVGPYLKDRKTGKVGPTAVQCRVCLKDTSFTPESYLKVHFPRCNEEWRFLLGSEEEETDD